MRKDHVLMHRGNIDDATGFLRLAEAAHEGLRKEEGALQIHPEDGVVVGFGCVPEVGSLLDAGVVDEDVATAKLLPGLLNKIMGIGDFGDVCANQNRLAAGSRDLVHSHLCLIDVIAIIDDAIGAFLRQPLGNGLTDAGARAGDDGNFSFKS